MNRKRVFKPIILLAFIAVCAVITMWLWNAIIPAVIGWGTLSYLQAVGLFILCRLLFGGFPGARERVCHFTMGDRKGNLKEQVDGMSRDQRREYIRNYRQNLLKDE